MLATVLWCSGSPRSHMADGTEAAVEAVDAAGVKAYLKLTAATIKQLQSNLFEKT